MISAATGTWHSVVPRVERAATLKCGPRHACVSVPRLIFCFVHLWCQISVENAVHSKADIGNEAWSLTCGGAPVQDEGLGTVCAAHALTELPGPAPSHLGPTACSPG